MVLSDSYSLMARQTALGNIDSLDPGFRQWFRATRALTPWRTSCVYRGLETQEVRQVLSVRQ